jgi:hypothetical protein
MRLLFNNGLKLVLLQLVFVVLVIHPVLAQKTNGWLPAPFNRHQTYPIPTGGVEVTFNPISLRWPFEKRNKVEYEVRLSQDSTFQKSPVFTEARTEWAMYNPHQKLAIGLWYWQYRKVGEKWFGLNRFKITEKALPMAYPAPEVFVAAIPRDHPRLLAHGSSELSNLQNRPRNADINAILAEAEEALKIPLPREDEGVANKLIDDEIKNKLIIKLASMFLGNRVYYNVASLCQAYALTGDERFAGKALAIGREVAPWDPDKVTRLSDFGDSRFMMALALVYDTFYDRLTPAEREVFRHSIRIRVEEFYQDWKNNIEVRVLSAHVWQHILHYFFQSALVLQGDEPEASLWLSYAYELFLTRSPILGGNDGGWVNGASYFRMNMETLLDIPMFIKKYTGFDFVNAHPWYKNQIDWMVYGMPPGSVADGYGDNNETLKKPGIEYVAFAEELAKLTRYPSAAWYADQCRKYEPIDLSRNNILRWFRLTKTPALSLPEYQSKDLPMAHLFKESGVVAMHTRPMQTEKDLMVTMRSSPYGSYGHMIADQNTFNMVYGGEKTFYRTGYKIDMNDPHRLGWNKHTKGSNGILIEGAGQPYSTEAFGMLTRFVQGERLSYVKGDASNAYRSKETNEEYGLTKFDRHLVLLQPGIVVIYDELEADRPVNWSWLIHSMKKLNLDAAQNQFTSQFEKSTGQGGLWSTLPVEWAVADTFEIPAVNVIGRLDEDGEVREYEDNQWHLKATNKVKSSKMRFLSVVQVGALGVSQPKIVSSVGDEKVTIRVGEWQVSAQLGLNGPAELRITDAQTSFSTVGSVQLAGKTYQGIIPGSTKLVELGKGKPHFQEASEELPLSVQQVLLYKKSEIKK